VTPFEFVFITLIVFLEKKKKEERKKNPNGREKVC